MATCPWIMCTSLLPEFWLEVEICTVDKQIYRACLIPKSYKWKNAFGNTFYKDEVTDWKVLTETPLPERFL